MIYLLLAIVLMAMDQQGRFIPRIRAAVEVAVEPVFHLVELPAKIAGAIRTHARTRARLLADNEALSRELLRRRGPVQLLPALEQENARLRALLEATAGRSYDFRFAEMVQVNLDPFSHQVLIDLGGGDGVFVGQAVIDGAGVMGQVENVRLHMSSVRLISDPAHALPVQILRTGLRTVAYGTGATDHLSLPNVPLQADVRDGDLLVTSGLGDRFPVGFPVAVVESIERPGGATFATVRARPLAALDRGREVLLVLPVPGEAAAEGPGVDPAGGTP